MQSLAHAIAAVWSSARIFAFIGRQVNAELIACAPACFTELPRLSQLLMPKAFHEIWPRTLATLSMSLWRAA